jgi:hypothetical protein
MQKVSDPDKAFEESATAQTESQIVSPQAPRREEMSSQHNTDEKEARAKSSQNVTEDTAQPSDDATANSGGVEHDGNAATTTDNPAKDDEKADATTEVKQTGDENADDASKYPTGTKLALLTFGLAMATFVVALDNTIIATAIPRITTEFNALNDVGWYGSAYLLTTTSLQPSFGKIYAYFDVKWVYLSALIIFEGRPSTLLVLVARADCDCASWLHHLRCCNRLPDAYRWQSCGRLGSRSPLQRWYDHCRVQCAAPEKSHLHCGPLVHVRYR